MANYEILKAAIRSVIKENANNEITGELLQQSLISMINSLGVGSQFMGIATPGTNLGTPDQKVFYIAIPGTYMGLTVFEKNIGILYYDVQWNLNQIAIETGVYKSIPVDPSNGIYAIYDLSIKNSRSGKFYWLQINRTESLQQLTIFVTDAQHIDSYTSFEHLIYRESGPFDVGIKKYSQIMSSGEIVEILVDWDNVDGSNSLNADKYVFQDWVFTGGRNSMSIPVPITGEQITNDAITEEKVVDELLPYMDYGVYKQAKKGFAGAILSILDLSIKNPVSGYYYWLQINRTESLQQATFFRTDEQHINSYTSYEHFVYKVSGFDTGIVRYTAELASGEIAEILLNWDVVSGQNSMTANNFTFQDWVFLGGRRASVIESDIDMSELPFDSAGIAKLVQNTDGVANNLISAKDFHIPENMWASGAIEKLQNNLKSNVVKFTSIGNLSSWQGYLTAFIKIGELEERSGLDFRNATQFLDISFGSPVGSSVWIVLRYEQDDSFAFYTSGNVDAVFNKSGSRQGLNADDATTWADASFVTNSDGVYEVFSASNIKIPYAYKGKNLYAIMVCVGGPDGTKTIDNLTCTIHNGGVVSVLFYYDKHGETIKDLVQRVEQIENGTEQPLDKFYAACGDSITNANHQSIYDVSEGDPYMPIDGYSEVSTYKRKCYAYYIAKRFRLKWANYGWGGTTLHHCAPKAYSNINFAPFVDARITQLKDGINWNYITIFFGWNDCAYGPIYQRDLWLQETYGTNIGYPVTQEQIGASGFANASQKAACDSAIGSVGGIEYTNTEEYFFARFIGTINDNTKNTWMGAWNYALEYLMKKYPTAKIMIVAPFVSSYSLMVRNSVKQIAEKWGVTCFDFEDLPYWYYRTVNNTTPLTPPSGTYWQTDGGYNCEPNVTGYNQARFSYDTLHPSNLGYETMSGPFGDALLNH